MSGMGYRATYHAPISENPIPRAAYPRNAITLAEVADEIRCGNLSTMPAAVWAGVRWRHEKRGIILGSGALPAATRGLISWSFPHRRKVG